MSLKSNANAPIVAIPADVAIGDTFLTRDNKWKKVDRIDLEDTDGGQVGVKGGGGGWWMLTGAMNIGGEESDCIRFERAKPAKPGKAAGVKADRDAKFLLSILCSDPKHRTMHIGTTGQISMTVESYNRRIKSIVRRLNNGNPIPAKRGGKKS